MKVPYNWLCDYVDIDKNIVEAGDALTLSGSKVEEVIEKGKEISKVVTGKITNTVKHPNSDHLTICQVDVKDETIQIVTGASNIREGDIVPVALHGSSLPGGVKIRKGKLRGVESNGMMCSEAELGIADENSVHGIMILPKDTPVGVDIKEILGLNGGVIDFEITSNRADCFCVYGIAREAAATFKKPLKPVELSYSEDSDDINKYLSVEVKDEKCRRYAAKMVKNVKIKPSPDWMQERLKDAGVRPINNIVDITNFVMLELGQPMHAFDYRFINGHKIIVRNAYDNEKFVTLDENERTLNSSMLVIADPEKANAVAGVMGGLNSEIVDDTDTIVFECANFDGTNVRLTSKKLGLRTESSSRYEKDIDPNLIDIALKRACALIEKTDSGEVVGGCIDVYKNPVKPYHVKVSAEWINKFLGTDIKPEKMKEYLERLEMKVSGTDDFDIEVPTFRQDVKIKPDVAEEVARLYGYDKIPVKSIYGQSVEAAKTKKQKLDDIVKNTLSASGLYEAMTYTFMSPKVFDKLCLEKSDSLRNAVVISNPLGEDFSLVRTTAVPSMLESLSKNYNKDNKEVSMFEIAKVFIPGKEALPEEKSKLVIGMYGNKDFYMIKGVIENLLNVLGIEKYELERPEKNNVFHPGRCAKLIVRKKNAGLFGEIHPTVSENYEIDDRVYIAELDLDLLYSIAKLDRKYKPLPKFPSVTRDIAMLVDAHVPAGDIESVIKKAGGELVKDIKLFDIYKGKQIPFGLKSMAYTITYRNDERTLKDEEVNKVHDSIVKALRENINAKLR